MRFILNSGILLARQSTMEKELLSLALFKIAIITQNKNLPWVFEKLCNVEIGRDEALTAGLIEMYVFIK